MNATTQYKIERMGDRVSDAELGLPEGTLEAAAELLPDPDTVDDETWFRLVEETIADITK